MKKTSACSLLILFALAIAAMQTVSGQPRGSGNLTTVEKPVSGFTQLEVHHGCRLDLRRGESYSVVIRIDDNLVDYLEVVQEGGRLRIGMKRGSYSNVHLEADVTMPHLEELGLSGGSEAGLSGFSSESRVSLSLSGGSELRGDLDAGEVEFSLSGGSEIRLEGNAGDIRIHGSGGSQIDLGEFEARDVTIELSGGSEATVNVDGNLGGSLSGGSTVYYQGSPTLGSLSRSGGSQVIPK